MSKKLTQKQFAEALEDLGLIESSSDVMFFDSIEDVHVSKSDDYSELFASFSRKSLRSEVKRLDDDDDKIVGDIDRLREDLTLLLNYLGLDIESGKRVIKLKKGKK